MTVKCDLHIHSCLSPCASDNMTPESIVLRAIDRGLDLIALTDHNSAKNCVALHDIAAEEKRLAVFYGLEITTREEVHILAVFDRVEQALEMDEIVEDALPERVHNDYFFGSQLVVDQDGEVVDRVRKYLGSAADLTITDVRRQIRRIGGLYIPSHVERGFFSMKSQLGILPEDDYDAIEVSKTHLQSGAALALANSERYRMITNSDSHDLESIGSAWSELEMESFSAEAFRESLKKAEPKLIF